MRVFYLHLTSNESTFEYLLPYDILEKKYKIGVLKIDGFLETATKIKRNCSFGERNIFVKCNLIGDAYVNDQKLDAIFRFRANDFVHIEAGQIIYHEVVRRPNKIVLSLVNASDKLIDFKSISLFIELHLEEF